MSSLERKIRRSKKKQFTKSIKKALGLFDKIPNNCLACNAPYDKMNKEQAMSWRVAVREKEEKVNLYCPDCWETATNLVEEIQKEMETRNEKTNT